MLGEAYMIKMNLQWEQFRYLSAMVYNVNCQKKSQMLKPHKLFPLPQDVYLRTDQPKSSVKDLEQFMHLLDKKKSEKKDG